MDLLLILLIVLIILALIGGFALSKLIWIAVIVLVALLIWRIVVRRRV